MAGSCTAGNSTVFQPQPQQLGCPFATVETCFHQLTSSSCKGRRKLRPQVGPASDQEGA